MKLNKRYASTIMDLSLLFFISLVSITVIFVGLGNNGFFIDLISLLITLILVIITYFTGIVSGLIFTLIFVFVQLGYVSYQYVFMKQFTYASLFWLIIPPLYCLSIFLITYQVRLLEKENERLKKNNVQYNALDAETHLRTLTLYESDFPMFVTMSQRFQTDLYTVVVRIRYWDSLKKLMTEEQTKELLKMITRVFQESSDQSNSLYMVNQVTPTWSSYTFSTPESLREFRELLKERFLEELEKTTNLNNLTIDLLVSQAKYDSEEMTKASDFLSEALNGLQYDV
ncbi:MULTISPECIES: diguanylate cyclase [unclassified Enterococcus]|uniref:diguanylate cyclase n=1 Tax=unclassified Enterococcus TaxID=2608891 RepID=UPI001CE22B11|nr:MULTISPECIES: diguanylate cyclase [unclassified Enterococcus]MCA5012976.1 diguanylate cyclase [Enterococcus sp. S23]MCA5016227.1 diguanylate cyclase [Enterococcus sp. S22(2020)]